MSDNKQRVRKHTFSGITRGLCPECLRVVDAQVLIRDGSVYLRKRCPEHGWHEALVSSDAGWYLDALKYNRPGAIPFDFAMDIEQGCPFDCDLCTEHQQHTCVGLIEITTWCDLNCPTCFADAGAGYDLSVVQVEEILDRLLEAEGRPEVVQISGGEPTVHPHLFDILGAAKARDIRHLMLNTNGLRLAEEPDFALRLAPYHPIVYLQFDGLAASAHRALRGRDLRTVKRRALDNLAKAGLHAALVVTVARGVNEAEIGDILRYGLEHPAVLGISYQPVTFAGRCAERCDPLDRVTLPDVLHALEEQTDGLFRMDDFRPVPCPHPTCSASTYAYVDGERVTPIPRILDVDDHLGLVANRAMVDLSAELKPALEALWSMAAVTGGGRITDDLACVACNTDLPGGPDPGAAVERFFMVHVHGFMDEHTFDLTRLMKCCVHQLLPDGRAVPFCAYNSLGYREQTRREQG